MNVLETIYESLEKKEFIDFLCGNGNYMIEQSQYSPGAELTDVGKVLSQGVYKAYKEQTCIQEKYEKSLMEMMEKTDFHVYMVCQYLMSQLFKENNNLSPFKINKNELVKKLNKELLKRKPNILNGILYPSGYINKKALDEIERFNLVCKKEYNVRLF